MRFACLGSGSEGNALVVEAGDTRILLDCGFGLRETATRLGRLGLVPGELDAIIVTHEHSDHIGGVMRLAARYALPVWVSHGTHAYLANLNQVPTDCHLFDSHSPFAIGALSVHPFPVPHDAREPTQFVFGDGRVRLGVLTDTGCTTPHIQAMLSGCEALVLECNHDAAMLANGPYPPALKRRVAGNYGHLDNAAAAELLRALDTARLQHIIAAHLSRKNNTPRLAREALAAALGCEQEWIGLADQDTGFGWREIA